ncbi:L-threonylcarbamoyladenylate synthase [Candidatus Pelagibacter sp.]|uniref:L-threonylcarbamoyladenylate synthase n=1 Tax=Candidatus Pelagibacter sp. TaxID=2024849 RepID=UPI003F863495
MKINLANIKKARNLLNKRECVAIPTETVYGIAANAYSDTACKKIFRLKKRPMNNPLIIHYYDLKKLKNDCDLNADFLKLYKRFCPGPITFILNQKKKSKISKVATNKKNTLAVRFPKHPVARTLLKYLKFPIAAPSANISSRVSAVTSSDVKDDFGKKIKYILEGGRSSVGVESTIIDLRKKPKILRLGGLEVGTIQKILKKKISINTNPSKISAPGQLKIHYSPGIPIRLNVKKIKKDEAFLLIKKNKINKTNYYFLSKKGDLKEAAKNLYTILRKIKKDNYKSIAVDKIPNIGIGKTINDRLIRASKF